MKLNDIPTDQWYQIFLDCQNGVPECLRFPRNVSFEFTPKSDNLDDTDVKIHRYIDNDLDKDDRINILEIKSLQINITAIMNGLLYIYHNQDLSKKAKEYLDLSEENQVEGIKMICNDVVAGNKFIIAINKMNDGKSLKEHQEQYDLFVQDTQLDRFVKISP